MNYKVFSTYHSAVIFGYFFVAIGLTLATFNLPFASVSFLSASVYYIFLKGIKSFIKCILGCLIIVLSVTIINPLVNAQGFTLLFRIGEKPITLEATLYGITAGVVLASVIVWFFCYSEVMTSDKFLSLFGRVFKTSAMMVAMILRYIPYTIRKSKEINTAQMALTGKKNNFKRQLRSVSVLMAWSMESAIETADSMKSRGYGSKKRTVYSNERFKDRDVFMLLIIVVLAFVNIVNVILTVSKTQYFPFVIFPKMSVEYWFYTLLLVLPLTAEVKERILCM